MIEHKIHFLGEKDYIPVMETQNRLWREQHVKNGKITLYDILSGATLPRLFRR